MKKKAISLLLVGAMVAAMVAGCGNASSDNNGAAGGDSSAKSESNSSAKSEGSSDGYTIAANIWGTGAYPLDIIVHADEKAAAVAGAKVDVADNQFTADKIVTDLLDYLSTYLITPDNAAHFKALYADESCFISDEQFQSLLYKYNPDVTVDTYDEFLKTYADTIYNLPE